MFLFVVYIFLGVLAFQVFKNIKCKRSSTDLFFSNYYPKNVIFNIDQLTTSYNELIYSFYKEKSMNTVEFYKIFELLTIHLLINWVIETLEEKEDAKRVKNHVWILNLIDKYPHIFNIDEFFLQEIKLSFIHKLIDNLQLLNQDRKSVV